MFHCLSVLKIARNAYDNDESYKELCKEILQTHVALIETVNNTISELLNNFRIVFVETA
jgi:hypothetical protein